MIDKVGPVVMLIGAVVWGVLMILDAFIEAYEPPASVGLVMLAVVGIISLFIRLHKKNGNGQKNTDRTEAKK